MRRIASIDIGTNTILLLIADVNPAGIQRVIHDQQVIARLGKGVDSSRYISQETFERVLIFLSEYKKICTQFGVDLISATGTSALRDAKNNAEFCKFISERTGISIEIISGEEEAQWTYRGGISEFTERNNSFSVIDIGGGSTEIIIGDKQTITDRASINIGSVRLTERLLKNSPPAPEAVAEAQSFISSQLPKHILDFLPSTFTVGVAGTVTTLASIQQQLTVYDPKKVSGFKLSFEMVNSIFEELKNKTLEQIKEIRQISEGRADILLGGILILRELMNSAEMSTITVSDRGLRYGILYRAMEKIY